MSILASHHAFVLAFGILGNMISFCVYLAPLQTFYRIYKKRSTESFQSVPYQVALFSSMLWLYYAFLKLDDAFLLVTINSFGCLVETIYITIYITFAPNYQRISAMKLFLSLNVLLFSSLLLLTQYLLHPSHRIPVLGWICVAFSVAVFAAPLSIVAQVVRTKSVEFMPFPLSFFLTLSAIMWFSYGLLQKDFCVAIPNVLGFMLGMIQMVLYAIYRQNDKKQLPEPLKSIVVLGTTEVHPVQIELREPVNTEQLEIKISKQVSDHNRKNEAWL